MPSTVLSSSLYHSTSFSQSVYFSNHNKSQQIKFLSSTTLFTSAGNSSLSKPSKNEKTERLFAKSQDASNLKNKSWVDLVEENEDSPLRNKEDYQIVDARNSKSQLGVLVETITAPPTTQKCILIHNIQKDDGLPTISDFNHLLMALLRADKLELVLKLYSILSSNGLVPDPWTYSIMISCYCKKNDPHEAKRLLDHMVEIGCLPDVATFTTLINSFCKKGRLQKAYEVLGVMRRLGCEPTINTYNCLLRGLCYVGRVEEAYETLMQIKKSSKKPDIYTYTAVMNGLCKVGRSDEAMELLDEARKMGLDPNVVSYNTLFNGYFKEGRPLDGIDLLEQMKERNCDPDYISYSTLLHGLLKWGEIRVALRIYKEMVGIGFQVDERMMNILLTGLCRKSRKGEELSKDVYHVFEKMKSWGYVIYPSTYGLVIEAFCNGKEMDKVLVNLQEMVRLGYSPKTASFNNVIKVLCIKGAVDEALSVLALMYERRRTPSKIPFNFLIDEFNRQGMSFGACNVYGAALKIGVVPHTKPRRSKGSYWTVDSTL